MMALVRLIVCSPSLFLWCMPWTRHHLHLVEEYVEHMMFVSIRLGMREGPYSASNRQNPGGKAHGVPGVTRIFDAKKTSL